MIKLLFILLLSVTSIFALNGEDVFKTNCVVCHLKSMGISDANEEIKAPPMNIISLRLKRAIPTKKEFVTFVKDYLLYPSQEKGYCMKNAYERFGVMPTVGTMLSEKERELVALWLYENFSTQQNRSMKCGSEKCGRSMRCGAGKCGNQ